MLHVPTFFFHFYQYAGLAETLEVTVMMGAECSGVRFGAANCGRPVGQVAMFLACKL